MNIQQSEALVVKSNRNRKRFSGLLDDISPDDEDDGLTEQRLEQWRPLWQNPFTRPDLGLTTVNDYPQMMVVNVSGDDEKVLEKPEMSRANTGLSQPNSISKPNKVVHAGPTWVHLFYDLAWTATFSALTQNGKFDGPWDNVSYVTFFVVMWWLWASQTLYSLHFYTNDWLHLFSIFVQLVLFGLLAASTRGYDVTMYILKSPGADTLDPKTLDQIYDPERYRRDRVISHSLNVIAFSIAVSHTIYWLQHMFVLGYAFSTRRKLKLHIPIKLLILPAGLIVSLGLFWAAAGLTYSATGKSVHGARIKFVLWGVALLVEITLHIAMEGISWDRISFWRQSRSAISYSAPHQPDLLKAPPQLPQSPAQQNRAWPEPHSNVNLRERLEAITTIILGEGLNGIAGTLYTIISAPGLGGSVAPNITCAALILYLLAYFYFEGPTGHRDPGEKGKNLRKMIWLMLHLPFLLCVILLLLGVKNQFLLASYLSTGEKTFARLGEVMSADDFYLDDPASAQYMPMKNLLLECGLVWANEFNTLNMSVTRNGSITWEEVSEVQLGEAFGAWSMQMGLKIMVQLYENLMGGNETIDSDIKKQIQEYYNNNTLALEDFAQEHALASSYHDITILSKLLDGQVLGARYITALAGIILISLGIMNRVHSKPRDRFQWGIILSRIAMGSALLLLLILNVGRYQTLWVIESQVNRRAGVIGWIWSWWVLPTLAVAFAVEFIIEFILLRCAGLAIARKRGRIMGPLRQSFFKWPFRWSGQA